MKVQLLFFVFFITMIMAQVYGMPAPQVVISQAQPGKSIWLETIAFF